jgi:hypothetical protein
MNIMEEFDKEESNHNKLMKQIDEQYIIMDKILKGNIFVFMWDMLFGHKYRDANKLAHKYLDEAEDTLTNILKKMDDVISKL